MVPVDILVRYPSLAESLMTFALSAALTSAHHDGVLAALVGRLIANSRYAKPSTRLAARSMQIIQIQLISTLAALMGGVSASAQFRIDASGESVADLQAELNSVMNQGLQAPISHADPVFGWLMSVGLADVFGIELGLAFWLGRCTHATSKLYGKSPRLDVATERVGQSKVGANARESATVEALRWLAEHDPVRVAVVLRRWVDHDR